MSPKPTAGDETRTGRDEPTTEKPGAVVLGRGETHIPEEDAVLLTDGGQIENMAYWRRNLEAALSSMEPETAVTERHNADDLVITPVGGSTQEERAELIHALERRGFEVTSSSEEEYIYVDVTDDRLDHPFADEDRRAMTDGGVEINDLEHDPRWFEFSNTPAVVVEVGKDDVVDKVTFADVQLRDCGALYWTEWTGDEGLIPKWRWAEVRYLDTERAERDGTIGMARIAPGDWNRLPNDIQHLVDQDDDTEDSDFVTDGGHHPDHAPTTSAPDWNEVKSSSFPDGGVARFPELVGVDRDILLVLARSAPCNGRELLADLETLRNEDIEDARLYPHLNELADAGLVEKRENYHDDRSHEFRLSDDGRHALREHAQRVQGAVEAFEEEQ